MLSVQSPNPRAGAPRSVNSSANGRGGLRHRLVLLAAAAARANGPDNLPANESADAAREDHQRAVVVRRVNPEELVARLAVLAEVLRLWKCRKPWL